MSFRGSVFRGVASAAAAALGSALVAFACIVGAAAPAGAAELRVSYAELAGVVQTVIASASIHLDNKPGGVLSFGSGSYVAIGGQQIAVPIPVKSFQVLGSTYAYYVSDINSQSIRATPVTGAVRLTVGFESDGPEMITGCIQGSCTFEDALPNVEWSSPSLSIDVVPVAFNGNLALKVTSVQFGGTLKAVCQDTSDFFLSGACEAGLSWANKTIAKLKPELAAQLKEKMNAPELQQAIADGLKKYLTFGGAGSLAINKVSANDSGVTVAFVLMTAGN